MATAYSGPQVAGSGAIGTYSTLYSTGAATTAVVSNILICNEGASAITFRIGIAGSATTPASGAFLAYDRTCAVGETLSIGPISLGNTKYIRCSASASTVSFTAAVAEIS